MESEKSGGCRMCGCSKYKWNPVSAVQKAFSGTTADVNVAGSSLHAEGMSYQDNTSKQVAYRNCMCGHHENYHS